MITKYCFSQPAKSSRADGSNPHMLPSQPVEASQKYDYSQDKTEYGSQARHGGEHYGQ